MSWIIEEYGYDKKNIEFFGSKFCTGNGYFGYRGTLEEYRAAQLVACTLSEIYDDNGSGWREPVNAANPLHTWIEQGGVPLALPDAPAADHCQKLDIQTGIHTRRTVFETADGGHVAVTAERFASIDDIHLLAMRYTVEADRETALDLYTGIDTAIWDANGPHFSEVSVEEQDGVLRAVSVTRELGRTVAVAETCRATANGTPAPAPEGYRHYAVKAAPGAPFVLEKYAAVCKDTDCPEAARQAAELCRAFARQGYDELARRQAEAWKQRWEEFDIVIRGDEAAQTAVRYSMYLLLISAPFHTDTVAIPARGLSGQVYKGGMFWDTEIYMLPMFAFSCPQVARNLMMYRVRNLQGALEKAQEYGYRGAFYPWESQETGKDGCTHYNLVDIFTNRKMRTYFRDKQVHISADVVYGLWRYMQITGDWEMLAQGADEVILQCARFFCSYAYYKAEKDRYELLDVTGADEYHERVNNDAYTNYMVKLCLQAALDTADYLRKNHPARAEQLLHGVMNDEDMALIEDTWQKLYLPQPNEQGVIEQFDGYFREEDLSIEELYSRIIKPNEYLGSPCGLAVNTQIIKQADVVLLLSILGDQFDRRTKEQNWMYYEPRTEHGSSLSTCIYALLAAEIGNTDWAYRFLMKAGEIDLKGNYKLYLGDLYIGGTHPAANGGTWMVTVQGFGGLHAESDRVRLAPCLPPSWQELRYSFRYHGGRFFVTVQPGRVSVRADEANREAVRFCVGEGEYLCRAGETIESMV